MAKAHDRILEITATSALAATTLAVTALKYYRDRAELAASNAYTVKYTPTSAQTSPAEITLGEVFPPPTHLRFVMTFNA